MTRRRPGLNVPLGRDRGRIPTTTPSIVLFTHRRAFGELLEALLKSEGFRAVSSVSTGAAALASARRNRSAVAILDAGHPTEDTLALARKLASSADARVVMIFDLVAEGWIARALGAGVCGFLAGDATAPDIVRAVRAARRGERFIAPGAGRVIAEMAGASPSIPRLSPREMAVLERVCQGLSTKDISRKLGLQPKAIDEIRLRLMAKTGTSRATSLVYYACAERYVDLRPRWEQIFTRERE